MKTIIRTYRNTEAVLKIMWHTGDRQLAIWAILIYPVSFIINLYMQFKFGGDIYPYKKRLIEQIRKEKGL